MYGPPLTRCHQPALSPLVCFVVHFSVVRSSITRNNCCHSPTASSLDMHISWVLIILTLTPTYAPQPCSRRSTGPTAATGTLEGESLGPLLLPTGPPYPTKGVSSHGLKSCALTPPWFCTRCILCRPWWKRRAATPTSGTLRLAPCRGKGAVLCPTTTITPPQLSRSSGPSQARSASTSYCACHNSYMHC